MDMKGRPGGTRHAAQGFLSALAWIVRIALAAVLIYIFFPPFWDALFAANLKALHEAPYEAADRARHLLKKVTGALREEPRRHTE